MWTAFVLGTVFGWWFGPMLTDITKKIWGAIKEWRQFR